MVDKISKAKVSTSAIKEYSRVLGNVKKEIAKIVTGQEEVIEGVLRALVSDGHVLIEGVPGIAKTLLIRSLGKTTGCDAKRIQFTIDLLPTDIIGLTRFDEKEGFHFVKGPIFANYVIADEINRASSKTQSALLEAMQEKMVTVMNTTYKLPLPFFVMANQNPIESAGVNPLPEAQVDRFLFKLRIGYPKLEDEKKIMSTNITLKKFEDFDLKAVTNGKKIIEMQHFVKKIYLSEGIKDYIVRIVNATREKDKQLPLTKYVYLGASPRASIGLYIASKAQALLEGKSYVTPQHVKIVANDVLRHRILLNYEGQAENIRVEDVIAEILAKAPVP
jgi:MoxR-like ATPase